ncbi:MAG: hypothetical protein JSV89_15225 [Spirochaetaceae bacterium]|nr:MAG: hypothetical protein JSV89_15225 [Spirochaetaceae bacterium]
MQRHIWVASVIALFILNSCSPAARLLLYIDPYEIEVLNGRGIGTRMLEQRLSKDVKIRVAVSPLLAEADPGLKHFADVVKRTRPEWIYLSPAHPFNPGDLAPRYPDIRFFLVDPAGEAPPNRISVVYDREQANFEAGRAIAALLGDADFLKRIGAAEAGALTPRIGILVAETNAKVESEIVAFMDGFSTLGSLDRIERKDIGNITDRVKARRLLDGMSEEAVAIVLLKTYVLTGFCLEYLSKEGGLAVVDEPIPGQAYDNTVLLMLVDDFLGALNGILRYIEPDSQATRVERVSAPVQLQWSETYRSLAARVLEGVNQ